MAAWDFVQSDSIALLLPSQSQWHGAKAAKLAAEMESLRSGKCRNMTLIPIPYTHARARRHRLTHFRQHILTARRRRGWRPLSRRSSSVTKCWKTWVEFTQTAVHEHRVYSEAKGRAAKLAEERRLQEFQRALEGMNPAEAEAALRAERERALRLQKEREARAASLDSKVERARAPYLEKYPLDNWCHL